MVPFDDKSPFVASGDIHCLGTPAITTQWIR
jgi:glycine/serine hydroxymethyltransferase